MVDHRYNLLDGEQIVKRGAYKNFFYLVSFFCVFVLAFVLIQNNNERIEIDNERTEDKGRIIEDKTEDKGSQIFQAFYDCVYPKLAPFKGKYEEFWYAYSALTGECDNLEEYNALEIHPARNRDEVKYVALPNKNESLTMVTLGIGHDVSAEIALKELHPNTKFFGADPFPDINKGLYENKLGGSYYQYAVTDQNGMQESLVYEKERYRKQLTQHIEAGNFFKNILQRNKIDILWIDIEGNEYPLLDQIHRNGAIDREGVKICQMNVELHKDMFLEPPGEMKRFHDFFYKLLEDRKYVLLKPFWVKYKTARFIRVFMINVADKECTDLFLK